MKKAYIVFTVLLLLSIVIYWHTTRTDFKSDTIYIAALDIDFKGCVSEVIPLKYGHDTGIVIFNDYTTNIDLTELNGERERFLIKLIERKAFLISNQINSLKKRDSLIISDTKYTLYRNGLLFQKDVPLSLLPKDNNFKPYYEVNNKIKKVLELSKNL